VAEYTLALPLCLDHADDVYGFDPGSQMNENFAMTVADALASETPVIATKGAHGGG
jgi:hypothetical protein